MYYVVPFHSSLPNSLFLVIQQFVRSFHSTVTINLVNYLVNYSIIVLEISRKSIVVTSQVRNSTSGDDAG